MKPRLSIVVPAYNNYAEYTKKCLEDLVKLPENHQIILVDNGSTDGTQELVNYHWFPGDLFGVPAPVPDETLDDDASWAKQLREQRLYVRANGENLGFAKACNIGYQAAKENGAEFVMFLNNDIRVRSNHAEWTKPILEVAASGRLAGPTMGLLDNSFVFVGEYARMPSGKNVYMSGWCITASIDTWEKLVPENHIGPFCEDFGLAFHEDTDLGFRARKLGIEFGIVPIPVHHFGHKTTDKLNTSLLYRQSRVVFMKKWG